MPRDGSGIYSKPANTTAVAGQTIESAKFNSVIDDVANDLNTPRPVTVGGTGASSLAAFKTALSLNVGTDIQAHNADLAAIAGLTSAADRLPYYTGSGVAGLATFTSFGRSLIDDADAAAARATLGLATIGQSEAEAGTSTTTRAFTAQRVKQAVEALSDGGAWELVSSATASNSASIDFNGLSGVYIEYKVVITGLRPASSNTYLQIRTSTNNGVNFDSGSADYGWIVMGLNGGGQNAIADGSDSVVKITGTEGSTRVASDENADNAFEINLYDPMNPSTRTTMTFWGVGADNDWGPIGWYGVGTRRAAEAVNAISIFMGTGNISIANAKLYGLKAN